MSPLKPETEFEARVLRAQPRYRWTADAVAAGVTLRGKTVIVTGATDGIGVPTALALARTGCNLVVTARDAAKAEKVLPQYKAAAEAAGGTVRMAALDLASYASVKAFATQWGKAPIDVLLHNAGLGARPYTLTVDGDELQTQVNLTAPVLLTELLLPNLTDTARVVFVSSAAHRMLPPDVNIEALVAKHVKTLRTDSTQYDMWESYAVGKSAEIIYANALNAELVKRGSGARALSVHPGVIITNFLNAWEEEQFKAFGILLENGEQNPQNKTSEQGAATSVFAALSPELQGVGGVYLENCQITPTTVNFAINIKAPVPEELSGTAPHVWDAAVNARIAASLRGELRSRGLLA